MTAIVFLIVLLAVIIAAAGLGLKLGYSDGWEARGLHEQNKRNMRRLEEGRAERAAKTVPAIDWDGWAASLRPAPSERLASTGELRVALGEHVGPQGAAGILTSLPGGYRPVTPPPELYTPFKLPSVSDTGSLRALTESTDAYLARRAAEESDYFTRMAVDEADYREGLTS
jgi:hypothetical protein